MIDVGDEEDGHLRGNGRVSCSHIFDHDGERMFHPVLHDVIISHF